MSCRKGLPAGQEEPTILFTAGAIPILHRRLAAQPYDASKMDTLRTLALPSGLYIGQNVHPLSREDRFMVDKEYLVYNWD